MKSTVSTLTAYFDESGIHEDSSHSIVAGFVTSDQEWNKFEAGWPAASADVVFHGNEFFGRKPGGERTKTYKGWSGQTAKDYLTGLRKAITPYPVNGSLLPNSSPCSAGPSADPE